MGGSNSTSSSSEDEGVISESEFNRAVRACGYPTPSSDVYKYLDAETRDFARGEMAMFLAQLIHESGGFQYREESNPTHRYRDEDALPGRSYHGRGYIQLSWSANYKEASRDLGMGDDLLEEPSRVSRSVRVSVKVSVWYWRSRVRPKYKRNRQCFGVTTNAINGAIECSGGYNAQARSRYEKYKKVARVLDLDRVASERGCYN